MNTENPAVQCEMVHQWYLVENMYTCHIVWPTRDAVKIFHMVSHHPDIVRTRVERIP